MIRYLDTLQDQITKIENFYTQREVNDTKISSRPVWWHLEHSLQVIIAISEAIQSSDPKSYKWRFNISRFYVMSMNHIPIGKGKAPKQVTPEEMREQDNFNVLINEARQASANLNSVLPDQYFNHPFFDDMKSKKAIKFITIHTEHHLKIIQRILKH